ncbi:Macrolide export protein MacA [bioreactor metagenome]|jgi:HlyD family secretion protein|uniref:Macrolide export protein MacA n=1 Tax=bioreactor metagenome TaxID=1076179 RepID=A0A644TZY3_9ZZZZ|nr:efflux RND transporter periplasmic adaptor subunit [Bacteroidales bacterium]WRQ33847.1 efflux RND transporter periplasmic adaptor subunit [Bacteroidales bacterium MB20-C3-3]MBP6453653.1 efflux RND transporter periplasmic adaptor subunit [Bacteroidales bacterium]MBP8677479.1 efflux RND transporter periplasmic adaptor subunit [Bacteroidales bacterium]MBP9584330.1 efflux RND transporter periplasmic adaptor subunit [Bacteroidales bacterium]
MKKSFKWIIGAAVIIIVVLVIFGRKNSNKGVEVTTQIVAKGTITEVIPANGKIKPVVEVKISPDVSGEIVELNFKEGDNIKRGELIIKIKQDVYISMRDRAEASLNSVKAQLTQQLAQFKQIEQSYLRNKTLYEQKAISEADYENALSQYNVTKEQIKAAEFNVKSATAALQEAQDNLVKTTIYAPMDGIISKMNVEKGERVVGTSQMAGTELLRIANFDQMEVLVDVNENDIIRIQERDTAMVEVDSYPGRKFTGMVTQIANSAKNIGSSIEQVTNFEVKILILPESYQDLVKEGLNPFRPGMSATASIQTERRDNIISIPVQTITTRNDLFTDTLANKKSDELSEQVFVVKDDNTLEVRKIETGIQDITNIEILSGLNEGERIVTGPYSAISKTLKSGAKVSWDDKKK